MSARPLLPPLLILSLGAPALAQDPPSVITAAAPVAPVRPDITGRWAQLQRTTALADVRFVGDVVTTTTALLLVDIRDAGEGQLVLRETVCAIDITSTADSVTMRIPPAFQHAVSGRERPVRLEQDGPGWRYVQPTKTEVSGAKLKDPARDKLPKDEDDPRVFDMDRDGKPGLTVQVRGLINGDIYVVQRDTSELTGALEVGNQRIRGLITWRAEQTVLDATSIFLSGDPPASSQHPDKRRSSFQMVRVQPGASCADVVANKKRLFP
jgi:hypothetical protein